MKKIIFVIWFSLFTIIFSIEKTDFLLCPKALNNPFWFAVENGMKDAAKQAGVNASFDAPLNADSEKQLNTILEYMQNGVKGIAVSPSNADLILPLASKAKEKGIPFITFDSDLGEKSDRLIYIGTDNFSAGKEAGKLMLNKIIEEKKDKKIIKIGIVTGMLKTKNLNQRIEGFKYYIEKNKNNFNGEIIIIDEVFSGEEDTANTINSLKNMNEKYKDLDAVFMSGAWALFGKEENYISAFGGEEKTKEKIIITFDTLKQELILLEKGYVDGLIGQKPYDMGYMSLIILHTMDKFGIENTLKLFPLNENNDRIIYTGLDIITKQNVKEFMKTAENIYNRR